MDQEERTLILLKPIVLKRNLVGDIISRIERKGLKIVGLKLCSLSTEQTAELYGVHVGKEFYGELTEYIRSGPVIAMVVAGESAVKVMRSLMGKTDPVEALPGTIRGDYGLDITANIVHGSDSPETAVREIRIFFNSSEIYE